MRYLLAFGWLCLLGACTNNPKPIESSETNDTSQTEIIIKNRIFNEDSAYKHIENQVGFGPRVPGTRTHQQCYKYIVSVLKPLADTFYIQNAAATNYEGKTIPIFNLIASFNPLAKKRILLCAHWDTRPYADQDTKDQGKPILGANDGASGVGVLIELAAALKRDPVSIGVDIVLFDAEDWGDNSGKVEDSYCLGSQYWGKNPHIPDYKADFGILLDMVGAPAAQFGFEGYSLSEAQSFLNLVWGAAYDAGYNNYFKDFQRGYVTDDHYYVMKYTHIPMIDIIDCDLSTESHFGKYWHTHHDNMEAIDRRTLKAVGQTLLNVVGRY